MLSTHTPSATIIDEVTSWPGIEAVDGDRGELSFRLDRREVGHLHGDRVAHFAFPRAIRAELKAQGRVTPHSAFPDSPGLAARSIEDADDVRDVIALLRLNYDRMAPTSA